MTIQLTSCHTKANTSARNSMFFFTFRGFQGWAGSKKQKTRVGFLVFWFLGAGGAQAVLWDGRCVVRRTLCTQGDYLSNRHSLGHLLMVGAVVWDARFVLKGSVFQIDTPWGISSGRTLRCGTYAVFSREVFLNRHSLGHLLREDAVLWDARCVLTGSTFEIDTPLGHPLRVDAV